MGMDLAPQRPSALAPRRAMTDRCSPGETIWGRYNWTGWVFLINKLNEWGVDTSEFKGTNDGALIKSKTCKAVADAIEQHLDELSPEDRDWLKGHIELWRTCGGYRQY